MAGTYTKKPKFHPTRHIFILFIAIFFTYNLWMGESDSKRYDTMMRHVTTQFVQDLRSRNVRPDVMDDIIFDFIEENEQKEIIRKTTDFFLSSFILGIMVTIFIYLDLKGEFLISNDDEREEQNASE